jgi:hypothetical protein
MSFTFSSLDDDVRAVHRGVLKDASQRARFQHALRGAHRGGQFERDRVDISRAQGGRQQHRSSPEHDRRRPEGDVIAGDPGGNRGSGGTGLSTR